MNAPPNNKCAGCQKPIPNREYLRCMACKATYDIDCANISYKLFCLMKKKDQWKCPECMSKRPKTGNINTPARPTVADNMDELGLVLPSDQEDHNITHRKKPQELTDKTTFYNQEMLNPEPSTSGALGDYMHDRYDMVTELKLYMNELIRDQTDSLHTAISELRDTIKAQNNRIQQLETRVQELENQKNQHPDVSSLRNTISDLQAEIHDRDQELLLNDIEITGFPEEANENSTHIVIALAKKIGFDLDEKDVVCAERAGPPRPPAQDGSAARPRPLAVRLTRRATRDALLRAARVRRRVTTEGLPVSGPVQPFYVNERLTRHHRQIFQKARELSRVYKFKYVWTREGKIFVRKEDGKPRHRLRSEIDLERVFLSN
ncbi:hypothetical protein ABMA27_014960 [Loxostege sticticalis]|uniref:FP protein C-terminal domain-containing protein n=1 Tax=Loxostege sticticalis TaxID=481309 RepID=A0ABR3IAS8_LOXSC